MSLLVPRSMLVSPIWSPIRTITYLHTGSRIRGLKRDPESYLKNPKGLSYNAVKKSDYQDSIRNILNLQKYGINISDDVLLQCFTHKSFAHGLKPYNEKLSLLGSQFLKYQASIYSINEKELLSTVAKDKIQKGLNDLNFTNLGTQLSKLLISKESSSRFMQAKDLDTFIFWKMRDPLNKGEKFNGEVTISNSVLNALVGGMLITNGPVKTTNFIKNELLNNDSDISLVKYALEHNASTDQ